MEPFKNRGYMMSTTLKFIREGLDPSRREAALAAISPETLRAIEVMKPAEWYSADIIAELYGAIVAASNGDATMAENDLYESGRYGASEAINSFLKLLMKVLTPTLFAKKLPSLYERDNSKGKITVDVAEDRLLARIEDCKGCPHVPVVASGWVTFALEAMGKQLSRREIHGWSFENPDSGSVGFDLYWRV